LTDRVRNDIHLSEVVLAVVEGFVDFMNIVASGRVKLPPAVTLITAIEFEGDYGDFINYFNFYRPSTYAAS
jgi:hypothetical protein